MGESYKCSSPIWRLPREGIEIRSSPFWHRGCLEGSVTELKINQKSSGNETHVMFHEVLVGQWGSKNSFFPYIPAVYEYNRTIFNADTKWYEIKESLNGSLLACFLLRAWNDEFSCDDLIIFHHISRKVSETLSFIGDPHKGCSFLIACRTFPNRAKGAHFVVSHAPLS